jgi:hypothetical protein
VRTPFNLPSKRKKSSATDRRVAENCKNKERWLRRAFPKTKKKPQKRCTIEDEHGTFPFSLYMVDINASKMLPLSGEAKLAGSGGYIIWRDILSSKNER